MYTTLQTHYLVVVDAKATHSSSLVCASFNLLRRSAKFQRTKVCCLLYKFAGCQDLSGQCQVLPTPLNLNAFCLTSTVPIDGLDRSELLLYFTFS